MIFKEFLFCLETNTSVADAFLQRKKTASRLFF